MKQTPFVRGISLLLAICMMFALAMPVYAEESEVLSNGDFPFTHDIQHLDSKVNLSGNFFKLDQKLYIDTQTILGLGNVFEETDAKGELRYSRTDGVASFYPGKCESVTFDGVTYYSYVDVLTDLCMTSYYGSESDVLVLSNVKNPDTLVERMRDMNDHALYRNEYFRDAQYNHEVMNLWGHTTDVLTNLFTKPGLILEKASGIDSYERYRNVVWSVLLPTYKNFYYDVEKTEAENQYMDLMDSVIEEVSDDVILLTYVRDAVENLDFILSVAGDIKTAFQDEDVKECINFYSGISQINKTLADGLLLIQDTGIIFEDQMSAVIRDTSNVYAGLESLNDLILKQVEQGGIEVVTSQLDGDFVADAYKAFLDLTLGTGAKADTAMDMYGYFLLQDKADISFHNYEATYNETESKQKKLACAKKMRDVMTVYLMAGYNIYNMEELASEETWIGGLDAFFHRITGQKMEKDEGLNWALREIKAEFDYLMKYHDMDFSAYDNAVSTQSSILANIAHRNQTTYTFNWDPAAAASAGGIKATLEGLDEKGDPFRVKYSFSDEYRLSNGLMAGIVRHANIKSGIVHATVYDFEGECAMILKPVNAGASLKDIGLTAKVDFLSGETFDPEDYLQTSGYGSEYYRIPLPFAGSGKDKPADPVPTEPVSLEEQETAANQFIFRTAYADYRITYDADIFAFVDKGYCFNIDLVNKGDAKYIGADVNASGSKINFDFYYREVWAGYNPDNNSGEYIGKSISQPVEVILNNGMVVKFFDVVNVSGKMANSPEFIDRYFYIDMGNGESFYCQDVTYERRAAIHGLSYEEAMKRAFVNIEVFPKADAPQLLGQESLILTGEKAEYRLTCDPSVILLYNDSYTDLYFTYKDGVEGELDGNVRSYGRISSEFKSFEAYVESEKDYFTNQFKKALNVTFGEPGSFAVGEFVVNYLPITYYNSARDIQFNETLHFYVDLGNGECLVGSEETCARYGDVIGYKNVDFLKKAFVNLEIVK